MIKGKKAKFIRLLHRYLGIILGIQFLFWTISGLYFSWTNIDEIHGDQFKVIVINQTLIMKIYFPFPTSSLTMTFKLLN